MTQIRSGQPVNYQGTIAILHDPLFAVSDDRRLLTEQWFAGAAEVANRHGFRLEKFPLGEVQEHPRSLERILRARGIRGRRSFRRQLRNWNCT